MREPKPSHDPRGPQPPAPITELPVVFEELYRSHFTGRVVLHFRSGVPSVVDVPGPRPRRFLLPT